MYYKSKYGELLDDENPQWTIDEHGVITNDCGDACWRTAMAWICYGDPDFLKALMTMILHRLRYLSPRPSDTYVHPEHFTRDQLLMAMGALHLTGELKYMEIRFPWILSTFSNRITFGLWMWLAYLRTGKKLYRFLFGASSILCYLWYNTWNSFVYAMMNRHEKTTIATDVSEIHHIWGERVNKKWLFWRKLLYPMYARHLNSFMNFVAVPNMTLSKLIMKRVSKENLLLMVYNGYEVEECDVYRTRHRTGFVWQSHFEHPTVDDFSKRLGRVEYALDRDILMWAYHFSRRRTRGEF